MLWDSGLQHFSVSPFGFRSYWDLVGPRGIGTKSWGTGLDKCTSDLTIEDFRDGDSLGTWAC